MNGHTHTHTHTYTYTHTPRPTPAQVYAVAFIARPLGALLFGSIADSLGRRLSLLVTVCAMGTSTTLVGCLPSYAVAGPAAPALLAALRIVMGFALGGEFTTAVSAVVHTNVVCMLRVSKEIRYRPR